MDNNVSSVVKLYELNNKESQVRAEESTQHNNTPTMEKTIKVSTGRIYQEDEKLRERSVKRRMEGLRLKVK